MSKYLLAIDQGTTSTRAIVFNLDGKPCGTHQIPLKQYFPNDGWVEHDPDEIWDAVLACVRNAMSNANCTAEDIVSLGITNQRETTILWDKKTGKPLHRAIVWQDRRTTTQCEALLRAGHGELFHERTGLIVDPYFSATKLQWLLEHIPGARLKAEHGRIVFGTIDTFILWRLTGGKIHATDATNASRTLMFNIKTQTWDSELLEILRLPKSLLPTVKDSCDDYGETLPEFFGSAIPIRSLIGDQQAATIGQACFQEGMVKSTYGTGCFVVLNTGTNLVYSSNRLLTTLAYRINGKVNYALEGSLFNAGTVVQWLRDGVKLIGSAKDTESLAASLPDSNGVIFIPAFTGLGAPYWDPNARGALFGLTRDTGIAHLVRAALESVCFQTRDLLEAMTRDYGKPIERMRVDGGMVVNDWLMQCLSDFLGVMVERPVVPEITALGAALLAGLGSGVYTSLDDLSLRWHWEKTFSPVLSFEKRESTYARWKKMVSKVIGDCGEVKE